MPNIKSDLDTHVAKVTGGNYTVTANGTATLSTSTLDAVQLETLIRTSHLNNYDVKLVAGVLTLQRR